MRTIDVLLPIGEFNFPHVNLVVRILTVAGCLLGLIAFYQFYRAKTTFDPMNPDRARTLITTGLFKYTRNPMYLAMFILLFALALILGNYYNLLVLALFVVYMTSYQIKREEEVLLDLFGDEFSEYASRVRRWL